MAQKVTPTTGGQEFMAAMDDEANLIERFFEKVSKLRRGILIQYFPRTGQYSGTPLEHQLPRTDVQMIHNGGAWVSFSLAGVIYRTETIACYKAFIAWIKELLDDTKQAAAWASGILHAPVGIRFYTPR